MRLAWPRSASAIASRRRATSAARGASVTFSGAADSVPGVICIAADRSFETHSSSVMRPTLSGCGPITFLSSFSPFSSVAVPPGRRFIRVWRRANSSTARDVGPEPSASDNPVSALRCSRAMARSTRPSGIPAAALSSRASTALSSLLSSAFESTTIFSGSEPACEPIILRAASITGRS